MSNYPNLEALGQGCVSGSICEWPMLKVEARNAAAEIKAMREKIAALEACVMASEEMRNWAGHYVADMAWQGFDRKPYQVELDAYDAARARVTLPPSPTSDGAGEGGKNGKA